MKKTPFIILLIGLITSGCVSNNGKNTTNKTEDSLSLKVALMPTLDCLPFYYAEKSGINNKLGLDVKLYTYNAQMDSDTAFVRQRVDVCYTDLIRAALLQSKGTPLHVIMKTNGHHELMTSKSKRISKTEHLKGKMVAIARHSITDFLLDTLISCSDIDPSIVYHPQINNIVLRQDMMRNATIDGAFLSEPYITQTKLEGHKSIMDSRTMDIELMAVMVNKNVLKDERKNEQIRLLIEGYNQAVTEINNNTYPDSIKKYISQYPIEQYTIDSLKMPNYQKATPIADKDIQTAILFLRKRELIHEKYNGDTLSYSQFTQH